MDFSRENKKSRSQGFGNGESKAREVRVAVSGLKPSAQAFLLSNGISVSSNLLKVHNLESVGSFLGEFDSQDNHI
jgi:hypothetical protein